jgi:hypothetical protein
MKLVKQQSLLPDVGQHAACSALSLKVHGGVVGEEEEWGRLWEREGGSEGHMGVQVCS